MYQKISKVIEVCDVDYVNLLLKKGWRLLEIYISHQHPVYILGKI